MKKRSNLVSQAGKVLRRHITPATAEYHRLSGKRVTPERFQLKDLVSQAMEKKEFSFITKETMEGDNLFREELAASSKSLDVATRYSPKSSGSVRRLRLVHRRSLQHCH